MGIFGGKRHRRLKQVGAIKSLQPREQVLVNKVLFQPPKKCFMILPEYLWLKILDPKFYKPLPRKMLKEICRGRGLDDIGFSNIMLTDRIVDDLSWQYEKETTMRAKRDQKDDDLLNAQGGVWTFGTGQSGQLGHNSRDSLGKATIIKPLRGKGIEKVCASFDSDVAFAISKFGDVFVWGYGNGPSGVLPTAPEEGDGEETKRQRPASANDGTDDEEDEDDDSDDDDDSDNGDEEEEDKGENRGDKEGDDKDVGDNDGKESSSKESADKKAQTKNKRANNKPSATAQENQVKRLDSTASNLQQLVFVDRDDLLQPVRVPKLCDEEISEIAVGRTHCAARTRAGDLFTWGQMVSEEQVHAGKDCIEPRLLEESLPSHDTKVVQVSVGTAQTFAIIEGGKVLSWGNMINAVSTSQRSSAPLDLNSYMRNRTIKQISCGATHCALLTNLSEIWTWGSGDGGRLGHGDLKNCLVPRKVEFFQEEVVIQVACSVWHTAAIVLVPPMTSAGWVYTWGTGRSGQLGQGGLQLAPTPGIVQDFVDNHVLVKYLSLGMYHNAALSMNDEVYTWGSNTNGCLGRPTELEKNEEDFCSVPGPVEGLIDTFGVGKVASVACGREFTVVATRPYDGPSREEITNMQRQAEAEAAALKRAEKFEKEVEQERTETAQRLFVEYMVNLLSEFPMCAVCANFQVCPGFQPDDFRPTLCVHCKHMREKHTQKASGAGALPAAVAYLADLSQRLNLTDAPTLDTFIREIELAEQEDEEMGGGDEDFQDENFDEEGEEDRVQEEDESGGGGGEEEEAAAEE